MFPCRIYIKEYSPGRSDDFFWKTLCIVLDNEALGFLLRQLHAFDLKIIDNSGGEIETP